MQDLAALMAQVAPVEAPVKRGRSRSDMAPEVREQSVGILQELLTSLVDLRLQARQAHWNVKGPAFYGLHKLFDDAQGFLDDFTDRLAERLVALGGYATSCVHCTARHTPLAPLDEGLGQDALVHALANGFALLSSQARFHEPQCRCDVATESLIQDLIEGVDKYLWQLEASCNE